MTATQRMTVVRLAKRHGIDPRFLFALQQTEQGPRLEDGTQGFGVLAAGARDTFENNGDWAARTIRRCVSRYVMYVGFVYDDWWDEGRERYAARFIRYFSQGGEGYPGYAQIGAENDPTNLNAHHFKNLTHFYALECGDKETA